MRFQTLEDLEHVLTISNPLLFTSAQQVYMVIAVIK